MNVLAIGAHPDDLENSCGGTLAKCAARGDTVVMAHLCNGDLGHFEIPRPKLAEIRRLEAEKAAAVIGATSCWVGIRDLDVYYEREQRYRIIELIRMSKPDLIITHDPNDYMPDHSIASQLVFDASFEATLPQLKTKHDVHLRLPPIYHMDTLAGVDFSPDEYVDITDFYETKVKMLSCHESQLTWIKEHDHTDFLDMMETQNKFRGYQVGCKYAEGFRFAKKWLRVGTGRLLP
jgi:LmbE family N-acetylglucosaminyl deacetylase